MISLYFVFLFVGESIGYFLLVKNNFSGEEWLLLWIKF